MDRSSKGNGPAQGDASWRLEGGAASVPLAESSVTDRARRVQQQVAVQLQQKDGTAGLQVSDYTPPEHKGGSHPEWTAHEQRATPRGRTPFRGPLSKYLFGSAISSANNYLNGQYKDDKARGAQAETQQVSGVTKGTDATD